MIQLLNRKNLNFLKEIQIFSRYNNWAIPYFFQASLTAVEEIRFAIIKVFQSPPVSPLLFPLVNWEIHPDKSWVTGGEGGKREKRNSIVKSNGTQLLIYFYFPSQHMLPSSFILVEICVLKSSGWLAVYYSTPGALKVQGLAARKVTTGSPLNSCKLLAGFGEAGRRGGEGMKYAFLRVACVRPFFCRSPPTPETPT